jgi:hypothetical protein
MYLRKGAAQPLPSRQETAHGPRVFRGPVPLHLASWPELGQRAQELAALPQRVPQFRNCEARARSSHSATAQARRAEEPEEVAALVANAQEFERIRAEYGTFARYIHMVKSEKDACTILQERFRHVGPYAAEFYLLCVGRCIRSLNVAA